MKKYPEMGMVEETVIEFVIVMEKVIVIVIVKEVPFVVDFELELVSHLMMGFDHFADHF